MFFGVWSSLKEVEMRKHMLVLTTTAAILTCGAIAATAQAPGAQTPGTQQSPAAQPTPGGPMQQQDQTRLQRHAQAGEQEDSDHDGYYGYRGGMMGPGMMGGGMMGPGMMRGGMMGGRYGHQDWDRGGMGRGLMGPMMMRMMFSLMDADGDGKLSLQEFQAAHERIFKAMDANKDGFVTLEEMQDFIRGSSRPASQQ
jgi:EF hand domain-containing protein